MGSNPISSTKSQKMRFAKAGCSVRIFGVMSPEVVSSLLNLKESDLPPLPLFVPVRRIIGDWCCSLHRGDVNYSGTSTSSGRHTRSAPYSASIEIGQTRARYRGNRHTKNRLQILQTGEASASLEQRTK